MAEQSYLEWVIRNTPTCWWHDSADPAEIDRGITRGAVGATTNPYLSNIALSANRHLWAAEIASAIASTNDAESRAEALMRIPVTNAARRFLPEFQRTAGRRGWVCAQVNPVRAGDRDAMLAMALRFHDWAPNVTVKLPATAAGLDVAEECMSRGICITATVSFTVPQIMAVAQRHRTAAAKARARGIVPGRCFTVLMIGRLDDYLREVAMDMKAQISESDIRQAGLAVAKRAYALLREGRYEVDLIVAALRGAYHMTELAGARVIMSIFPTWQKPLIEGNFPRQQRIDAPVPPDVIDRLSRLTEFVRAYEPDGLRPDEFCAYGVTQRTLCQFYDAGWKLMEAFKA